MTIWDEILNSIITKLSPTLKTDTKGITTLAQKMGDNNRYMAKARESLGDVATMISPDTLKNIARTIKDSENAKKFRNVHCLCKHGFSSKK